MSEVLTEIVKADPTFDKDSFLKQCQKDIIPNILEVIWLFFQLFCLLWSIVGFKKRLCFDAVYLFII